MSDVLLDSSVEQNNEVPFLNFRTSPIVGLLKERYKAFERYEQMPILYIPEDTTEHSEVSNIIASMLDSLPWKNEIGDTIFGRNDAKNVISALSDLLKGNQTWEEISWIAGELQLEVFKNEVYEKHNINSAICYSLDLGLFPNGKFEFTLERFHITKDNGILKGVHDGKFTVKDGMIIIDPTDDNLLHIHSG